MTAPPLIVSIDGPSATGKSSTVATAAARFGWVPLAEAFDRLEPTPDLRFRSDRELAALERSLLEEDGRRWSLAREIRRRRLTVVTDTGFLGPLTYTEGLVARGLASPAVLRALVARARTLARRGAWGLPDGIVYLASSRATRRSRAVAGRRGHPADLEPRHESVGRWEARFYRDRLPVAFPGRVVRVDAEAPVATVARGIARAVGPLRPLPRPEAAALRVLELFEPGTSARGRSRNRGNR